MNRESSQQSNRSRCAPTDRGGFTLVELMVVIIIIAILAGLLIPAIGGAVRRAKNAKIALEIAALSQALERYKMEYGEYPPDFADRRETNETFINQHLSRIFRYRNYGDFPYWQGPTNTASPEALQLINLEPGEALYFWLRGFSSNPQYPLAGAAGGLYREGAGHTSLFSFDKSRLSDVDGDGFVEYYPAGAEKETPYVYYRANVSSNPGSDAVAYDHAWKWAIDIRTAGKDVAGPYFSANKVQYATSQTNAYAAPKKFQIISAGLGGIFGKGGEMTKPEGSPRVVTAGIYPTGPYPDATHYGDRDNLTSFSEGGTLKDAQE